MKIYFSVVLSFIVMSAYGSDFNFNLTDADKILKMLPAEQEIIVVTPKGQTPGVLIKRFEKVALIAYSRDFSRGLEYKDVSVTTKTSNKFNAPAIPAVFSSSNEKLGFIIVLDDKDLLGKEAEVNSKLDYFVMKGTDVSPLKISVTKPTNFLIVGRVKVGGFLGETGADGLVGNDKYAIEAKCNLGSIIVYQNNNVMDCSKRMLGASKMVGSAEANEKGEFEFLLNDKKTSDNSGQYIIIYSKN
jgi:hypothetical protein